MAYIICFRGKCKDITESWCGIIPLLSPMYTLGLKLSEVMMRLVLGPEARNVIVFSTFLVLNF